MKPLNLYQKKRLKIIYFVKEIFYWQEVERLLESHSYLGVIEGKRVLQGT